MDKPGCWTNRSYLIDFIDFPIAAKRLDIAVFKQLYLEKGLSAAQIAEMVGVSKQMVLARIRRAGIHRTAGRGRAPDNYRYTNPPFGFRVSKNRLVPSPSEMKIVRLIVRLRTTEHLGWETIVAYLSEKGIPSRTGGKWDRARVKRVFKRWSGKI